MKTKKIAAVFLTCIVAIGLMAGCGASNTNQSASNNDSHSTSTNQSGNEEADTNSENTTDTTENTSTGNGKTLVVYYSASGNTKDVAEKIAKITEADLFEIEPVEPYTDDDLDWTDDDSRVSREHDDESLRDVELVSTTVDNWDSYDTVYIGTPTWWYTMAPAVLTFLTTNDFTGKTVIPFMTNGGWPGHVIKDMKENCKGAAFAHEMQIQFDSKGKDHLETSEEVITEWIGQINTDINK